ncbi:uncharacterized protein LOC110983143 [Acanthaster planci]|uniref:Uncharacterized protein LOC110983143 n=1 Tax=Acanthaster planci TaxID=133434 RepID=A0A8B7YZ97_ACAPL|nr:uncharacterized protein LOC110983143 [Acanthaster planci]
MDLPEGYGCYVRANEALAEAHRHSHLRFNQGFENVVGHQPPQSDASAWFNPPISACVTDTSASRQLTYPTAHELEVPGTSDSFRSVGGGSRFMEIVHGTAPARDQSTVFEETVGYHLHVSRIHAPAHLTRPNPYLDSNL